MVLCCTLSKKLWQVIFNPAAVSAGTLENRIELSTFGTLDTALLRDEASLCRPGKDLLSLTVG